MSRPVVLAMCDYYLPGYKAGGPIPTLAGMVDCLEGEFLCKVITRDRDLGDTEAYPQIAATTWNTVGAAQVMYLSPPQRTLGAMRRLIAATHHDVLYLNSYFSVPFAIMPLLLRRFGLIPRRPTIVAPHGEFSPGALAFKSGRKRFFIAAARLLGLTRNVVWQASGLHEAQDIRRSFGEHAKVMITSDLAPIKQSGVTPRVEKQPGHLRLIFLSRVSRMKNLDGALTLLQGVTASVQFTIHGPIEDSDYWRECQNLIKLLPANITVEYGGPVKPDQVGTVFAQHDLFFLPTLGESFGHVILEAMVGGCPVLISDRTRWRGLEAAGVGWDVPLSEPERFRDVIRQCEAIGPAKWREMSERAREYGLAALNSVEGREENRELFRTAYRDRGANSRDSRPSGVAR